MLDLSKKQFNNLGRLVLAILAIILILFLSGCETSEGTKYGTLQKLSHKTFPCGYYIAEFAFEGGKVEGTDSKAYSNTQLVEVDKIAYDSLQAYIGDKVLFDYKDVGFAACGESKKLTFIKRK